MIARAPNVTNNPKPYAAAKTYISVIVCVATSCSKHKHMRILHISNSSQKQRTNRTMNKSNSLLKIKWVQQICKKQRPVYGKEFGATYSEIIASGYSGVCFEIKFSVAQHLHSTHYTHHQVSLMVSCNTTLKTHLFSSVQRHWVVSRLCRCL